jgi:hypothetical protein
MLRFGMFGPPCLDDLVALVIPAWLAFASLFGFAYWLAAKRP